MKDQNTRFFFSMDEWRVKISRLRFEEFIAVLFFVPMMAITLKAYFQLIAIGNLTRRVRGGLDRILGTVIAFYLFSKGLRKWWFIRDWLPFAFCIAIYTNLHDTIHFVNPHDIQDKLMAIDQWMFGVQPCVWSEQFINPVLTDIFTFCYSTFFWYGPSVALALYFLKREKEFRHTILSIILGFYIGYILYIIFPAAPPRYMLRHEFTISLHGGYLEKTGQIINLAAHKNRGAFPSLHTAGTIIALACAWRYIRWMFWILTPIGIGLILGTVYLRHHYVVDIIAGVALAPLALWVGAKADPWWDHLRNRYILPHDENLQPDALKTTYIESDIEPNIESG